MKRVFYIFIFLLICTVGHATHNRAGQILYRHISGYTYEFTIIVFYYTPSLATAQRLRDGLAVTWGDNQTSQIQCIRQEVEVLPDDYTKAVFREKHTFPGNGTYTIIMEDRNRNDGVLNIPNSVDVYFCLKTVFRIDPNTGHNSTPELLTYPIDKAAIGRRFVHNPSAFDSDGDSLSYELAICLRDRGIEIEEYSFPEASGGPDSLYVHPVTGDFVWDAPVKKGFYNVAMRINEWRDHKPIGSITRDMQIEVVDTDNRPPEFPALRDTCVVAGAIISIPIHVTDPDNDLIKLTATGGAFQVPVSPAENLKIDEESPGYTNATFTWQTDVSHVRKQPYTVVLKAEDQNTDVKLVAFANFNITVIAPEVENLTAEANKKEIQLEWNPSVCDHASGYEIYRRVGSNDPVDLNSCETGIPSRFGYEMIDTVKGVYRTAYYDSNKGRGLSPGIEYCYRVVAIFSDGAKSLPSGEACASLLAGTPPMIRAHVETVDMQGEIHVAWLEKPVKEVIEKYMMNNPGKTGPFEYRLFHTLNINAGNWTQLGTPKTLGDTVYIHENIDTKTVYPYYYKVELWDKGDETIVDEDFEIASTLYPILEPSDKAVIISFGRLTPWVNAEFDIYRCVKTGSDVCIATELVGRTNQETYKDVGLKNAQEYCYRIESKGYRIIDGIEYRNTNWSHVASVAPYDNVPPCAPELTAESICEESRNLLEWKHVITCAHSTEDDMEKFHVYFTPDPQKYDFTMIDMVNRDDARYWLGGEKYSYSHNDVMVGCYYVTAADTAGNESTGSNIICLDECGDYDLPNVFTPNGDNINDVFKSYNPGGVTKVNMKIYNRAGKLVFKTEDPDINWDGRDIDSKRFVSTGVYFYVCEVYEERLTGPKIISLSGFIHVFYGEGAQPYVPPIE